MTWPPTTHQDVEDDLTNGHGWAGSLVERYKISEQLVAAGFPWVSGRFYSTGITGLAASNNNAAAGLYLAPFYAPVALSIDQISVNVTTAGTASHVARLGIYNSDPSTGMPTTVAVDAGTVVVDTLGAKALTVSLTISGLVWFALTAQSGSFTGIPLGAQPVVGGMSANTSTSSGTALLRASTPATSALPNLTGDGTVGYYQTGNILPRVVVRAA